jgi:hypothetical protein
MAKAGLLSSASLAQGLAHERKLIHGTSSAKEETLRSGPS